MRPTSVLLLAALILAETPGSPIAAQAFGGKIPRRPHLPADRDTNSAQSYFYYGASALDRNPEEAASAFYWASRLDPYWADPIYGQYVALLLAQPTHVITGYLSHRPGILRDRTLRSIDSLAYLALLRNPFVDRRFDGLLVENWLYRETHGAVTLFDLGNSNPQLAGWVAYAQGRFKEAASHYATALRRHPNDPSLQLRRASTLVALGLTDSARTAVQAALATWRDWDSAGGRFAYESYPFAEYSIGLLFERGDQRDSARAAYERALLDDVSFYPAHLRLARLRLASHDTIGALAEYAHATTLAPGDAGGWYEFGMLLIASGQPDSGVVQLRRATAVEPFFAQPHYPLGLIYERSGFVEEAAEEYETFLRLIPRSMAAEIAAVRRRLEALSANQARP
jgi:tetratricopeptide (TPR) repeat protein